MPHYLQAFRDAVDATADMATRRAGERDAGYLARAYLQALGEMLDVLEDYERHLERAGADTAPAVALYERFIASARRCMADGTVAKLQKFAKATGWRDIEADDDEDAPVRRDDALFDARDDD